MRWSERCERFFSASHSHKKATSQGGNFKRQVQHCNSLPLARCSPSGRTTPEIMQTVLWWTGVRWTWVVYWSFLMVSLSNATKVVATLMIIKCAFYGFVCLSISLSVSVFNLAVMRFVIVARFKRKKILCSYPMRVFYCLCNICNTRLRAISWIDV